MKHIKRDFRSKSRVQPPGTKQIASLNMNVEYDIDYSKID